MGYVSTPQLQDQIKAARHLWLALVNSIPPTPTPDRSRHPYRPASCPPVYASEESRSVLSTTHMHEPDYSGSLGLIHSSC